MLKLHVILEESYDEEKKEFVSTKTCSLELEHSLASLSKWESEFEKPFLTSEKTIEDTIAYVRAMTLTSDIPPEVYTKLSQEHFETIKAYIEAKNTATWFVEDPMTKPSREIITAERMYYWMIAYQIPFECQFWHLNRLLTLIRVCNEENKPKRKLGPQEAAQRMYELNERRKKEMNTTG